MPNEAASVAITDPAALNMPGGRPLEHLGRADRVEGLRGEVTRVYAAGRTHRPIVASKSSLLTGLRGPSSSSTSWSYPTATAT